MANTARIKSLISWFSDLANNIQYAVKKRDGVLDMQSCQPLSSSAVYRKLRVSSRGASARIELKCFRKWLASLGIKTLYIEPGSPWENGYVESFIGKLRDELLNGEIFDTLLEARVLTECCRREYNRYPGLIALWDTDHRHQGLLRMQT